MKSPTDYFTEAVSAIPAIPLIIIAAFITGAIKAGFMESKMRDWGSVWRGLKAMNPRCEIFKRWHIRFGKPFKVWLHYWTPIWHEGRGFYFTMGVGYLRIMRGY